MDKMDGYALTQATAERNELLNRVEKLNAVIEYLQKLGGRAEPTANTLAGTLEIAASERFKGISAVKAAEAVLKGNRKPMHIKELTNAVLAGGYDRQRDFKKLKLALYTNLVRSERFLKAPEGAVFALTEWASKK